MPIPLPSLRWAAITVPSSIPQFPHGQSLINSSSFLFLNNSTLSQTNSCAITMFPALPIVRFPVLFRVNLAEIFTPLPLKHSGLATLTLQVISISLPFAILAGHAAFISAILLLPNDKKFRTLLLVPSDNHQHLLASL